MNLQRTVNSVLTVCLTPGDHPKYALVIHTFEWLADNRGRVRLISARRPTKTEIRDYEEQA